MLKRIAKYLGALGAIALTLPLLACGGSGGGSSSPVSTEPEPPPAVTPAPEPVGELRLYQQGDRVEFVGTLALAEGASELSVTDVTVSLVFEEPVYTLEGKNVLAVTTILAAQQTGDITTTTVHRWQEADGSMYDLADQYGNTYVNSATNDTGLLAVPQPLLSQAEEILQFYTMYGGHTSGYLTMGERVLSVGDSVSVTVPLGRFDAIPLTRVDDYEYSTTFDEFKRDERVVDEQTWWLDPEMGLVKYSRRYRHFSRGGDLLLTREIDLEATALNF